MSNNDNGLPSDTAEFVKTLIENIYGKRPDRGASVREVRSTDGVARTHGSVSVGSKALVMKVLLDAEENYSVSGYKKRAQDCLNGNIYLGLDKGAEYDRQATKANQAIMSVTAAEAFALTLRETRRILVAGSADDLTVIVKVVARLCSHWFDLPDGAHVVAGPPFRERAEPPAQCPGDFTRVSGYIFNPVPEDSAGPEFGALVVQAVSRFVADLRAANKLPEGALSGAVFDTFPSGEDDLVARTIIGMMTGLPTTVFNVYRALHTWRDNGGARFTELQQALSQHAERDAYLCASAVLEQPLMQAMQLNPVPPKIWRTASTAHTLGTDQVNPGDVIVIDIESATREDYGAGTTDVFPVFGGDRRAEPYPTHACSGYEMAFGIMLGIINGLMEPA